MQRRALANTFLYYVVLLLTLVPQTEFTLVEGRVKAGNSRRQLQGKILGANYRQIVFREFNTELPPASVIAEAPRRAPTGQAGQPNPKPPKRERRRHLQTLSDTYFGHSLEFYDGCACLCFIDLLDPATNILVTQRQDYLNAVVNIPSETCVPFNGTSMCLRGLGFAHTVYYGEPKFFIPCSPVEDPYSDDPPVIRSENVTFFTGGQLCTEAKESYQRIRKQAGLSSDGTEVAATSSDLDKWIIGNETFDEPTTAPTNPRAPCPPEDVCGSFFKHKLYSIYKNKRSGVGCTTRCVRKYRVLISKHTGWQCGTCQVA